MKPADAECAIDPTGPRTAGSRVVDYVVNYLTAAGVGHIFGVHGANIEDLYDAAFFCPDVTAVLAKRVLRGDDGRRLQPLRAWAWWRPLRVAAR